jgi:hypothetical protein
VDKEQERRKHLAALPFSEKLKILGKLRDRSRAISASGLRKKPTEPRIVPSTRGGAANRN